MKSSIIRLGTAATLSSILASCGPPCEPLGPRNATIAADLGGVRLDRYPIVAKTPVVDMHIHTFNARYLPLKGVLLGKRDVAAPVSWLLSDSCAEIIAADLVSRTRLAPLGSNKSGMPRNMHASTPTTGRSGIACRIFAGLIDKGIQKGIWNPAMSAREQMALLDDLVENDLTFSQRHLLAMTGEMMGMEDAKKGTDRMTYLKTIARFLWTTTQSDDRLVALYRQLHSGTYAGQIRVVSHMMDLAPVYDQRPDDVELLDYETQQIPRTRQFTRQQTSGATYFVAYNPYRNHWNGGKPGDALRIVKHAVLSQGAAGVKIYPPSGYRATGNDPKPRPRFRSTEYPGSQWDARYGPLGGDAGKALDLELEALLVWCTKQGVPVFTHCGHGEFEARKGYGEYHANPMFWQRYLASHPEPDGSPCKLKLCLGHAGGEDHWFGCGDHGHWGETVFQLCATYPNVYCEITSDAVILDKARQAFFVERIAGLISQSRTGHRYDFGKKLLYGSDWPQPDRGDPAAVLRETQRAFLHPDLIDYYTYYFHRNAARYLGRSL